MLGPEHHFVWENLHAYALGALDKAECERIKQHLAHCPVCQQEAVIWQEIVHKLAFAVPLYEPPATLRATIRQLAAASSTPTATTSSLPVVPPSRAVFSSIRRRSYVLLSTLLALFLGLATWNVHLYREVNSMASAMAEADQMQDLLVEYVNNPNGFDHFTVDGPNGSRVHLLYDSPSQRLALVADGLPWRGENTQYSLWFYTSDGTGFMVTVFRCDRTGRAVVIVDSPLPLESVLEIAIIPANAPNSDRPILNGRLRRREGMPVFLARWPL